MHPLPYTVFWLLRLAAALIMSFLLFTSVALLHATFGPGAGTKAPEPQRRIQTVDLVRKQEDKKKAVLQRIRQMQTPAHGKTGPGRYEMRFSPDLAIDAPATDGAAVTLQQQELTAEIFEQGQVDQQAIPENTPPIPYPERAIEQELSGNVEVMFVITYQGRVSDIQIVNSPSPMFSNAVMRGVAQWRFKPAQKKGIPVNQRYRRTIEFKLE